VVTELAVIELAVVTELAVIELAVGEPVVIELVEMSNHRNVEL